MKRLAVLADDFTGALDTGVQFAQSGLPTTVCLWRDLERVENNAQSAVLVIDTESRHLQPELAYDRVLRLTRRLRASGFSHYYKKTDSTLRGHIGQEILAMQRALGNKALMFIPAYPKMKRTTRSGVHYVDNLPLNKTAYARDLLNPVKFSYIPDLLAEQAGLCCRLTAPPDFTGLAEAVLSDPSPVWIFDAQTQADLADIACWLTMHNLLGFTAGCAGFAEFLAGQLRPDIRDDSNVYEKLQIRPATLILCGSSNGQSLRQLERFSLLRPHAASIIMTRQQKSPAFWKSAAAQPVLHQLAQSLELEQYALVRSVQNSSDVDPSLKAADIAASFAALVLQLLADGVPFNLVIFGGDTLFAVMHVLAASSLFPMQEISAGVVASVMQLENDQQLLISKAGGLGSETVLDQIMSYIDSRT